MSCQRYLYALLAFLFACCSVSAQSESSRNHILLELGGYGIHYSVNYNRVLSQQRTTQLEARLGVCILPIGVGIPAALSLMITPAPHRIQASLGGNVFVDNRQFNGTDTFVYLGPALGYRFEPGNQPWFAFATVNPMLKTDPTARRLIDPNPVRILSAALGIGWKLE